jgi:hypothetical protein
VHSPSARHGTIKYSEVGVQSYKYVSKSVLRTPVSSRSSAIMKSILSLLVAAAAFSPVLSTSTRSKKSCQDYKIPITVTSQNFIFGPPTFKNDYDLTDFVTDLASRTAPTDFHPFSGQENQTATYTIAGTFCTPKDSKAKHKSTVILATHGLNFNRGWVIINCAS